MAKKTNNEHLHYGFPVNYGLYDFETNKEQFCRDMINQFLTRTTKMFEYKGLPDTIPSYKLEELLQLAGSACITKVGDNLYALYGSRGGEYNENYEPTIYTVANPYLDFSANLDIGKECVEFRNDTRCMGILPILSKYCTLLTETEISMRLASINARVPSLITANDDNSIASANTFLSNIASGKLGVIADDDFIQGIKALPYSSNSTNTLIQLLEMEQYLRGSLYNEIGLQANYNMKRESINSNESQLNEDMLYPLIDNMFDMRKKACEDIEKMYGIHIEVSLSSAWKDNAEEKEMEMETLENAIEETEKNMEEGDNDEVKEDME